MIYVVVDFGWQIIVCHFVDDDDDDGQRNLLLPIIMANKIVTINKSIIDDNR